LKKYARKLLTKSKDFRRKNPFAAGNFARRDFAHEPRKKRVRSENFSRAALEEIGPRAEEARRTGRIGKKKTGLRKSPCFPKKARPRNRSKQRFTLREPGSAIGEKKCSEDLPSRPSEQRNSLQILLREKKPGARLNRNWFFSPPRPLAQLKEQLAAYKKSQGRPDFRAGVQGIDGDHAEVRYPPCSNTSTVNM